MSITDNAVYVDGVRTASPPSLALTLETMRHQGGFAWIDMLSPGAAEIGEVAAAMNLHELAVEDAVKAHQRSKLERYDDVLFVVFHPARYVDESERVEFTETHLFVGPEFVVSVRRDEFPDVSHARRVLESRPDRLRLGPFAVLHALLDDVVDGYAAVVAGLENDIDEVEDQLFNRAPEVSRRIYALSREVIAFQRATRSIQQIVEKIATGTVFDEAPGAGASGGIAMGVEIERAFRDVQDHAIRYTERAAEFRTVLGNALTVHSTLVAQEQNEEMQRMTAVSVKQAEAAKKISSWAAVFLAPTLVAGIYGMNFDRMPELHWVFGYPFALAVMAAAAFGLYAVFKRVDWL